MDLHSIPRREMHQDLLKYLRDELLVQIEDLDQPQLGQLLIACFPYINLEELRPVAFAVMSRLETVGDQYLGVVVNPTLWAAAPTEVKRHVWLAQPSLLPHTLNPLIAEYARLSGDDPAFDLLGGSVPASARRPSGSVVWEVCEVVGSSVDLLRAVCEVCGGAYRARPVLASLRLELLLALRDRRPALAERDPLHDLARLLDACISDNAISERRHRDIAAAMGTLASSRRVSPLELALFWANPYVLNLLTRQILQRLNELIDQEIMPTEDSMLPQLVLWMSVGVSARKLSRDKAKPQKEGKEKEGREVKGGLAACALLSARLVDDRLSDTPEPPPLSPKLEQQIRKNEIARRVFFAYLVERAQVGQGGVLAEFAGSLHLKEPTYRHTLRAHALPALAPLYEALGLPLPHPDPHPAHTPDVLDDDLL